MHEMAKGPSLPPAGSWSRASTFQPDTRSRLCRLSRPNEAIDSLLSDKCYKRTGSRESRTVFIPLFFFPHLILCSQNEMDGVLFPGDHSCAEVPHPSPSSARLPWCIGRGRQGHLAGAQPFQAMLTTWPTLQCSRP